MIGLDLSVARPLPTSPIQPSQSNLAAWYDPSDRSTLWQDLGRTVPVTANGQPVAVMTDKSGNGFDLSQPAAAARPIYHTNGILHWLSYDGIDDTLGCAVGPSQNPGTFGLAFALDEFTSSFANLVQTGVDMPRLYVSQSGPNQIRGFWGNTFLFVARSSDLPSIGPTSVLAWVDGENGHLASGDQVGAVSNVATTSANGILSLGLPNFKGRIFAATYHYETFEPSARDDLRAYLDSCAGI